jgi:hypothetical protein
MSGGAIHLGTQIDTATLVQKNKVWQLHKNGCHKGVPAAESKPVTLVDHHRFQPMLPSIVLVSVVHV